MLTAPQVAIRLQVALSTVHKWILVGILPAIRIRMPGSSRVVVRISVDALEAFIAQWQAQTAPGLSDDTAELLEYLSRRDAERAPTLCPRCATRPKDPASKYGWCAACTREQMVAEDEARERERARQLRWWQKNGNEWRAKRRAAQKEEASNG